MLPNVSKLKRGGQEGKSPAAGQGSAPSPQFYGRRMPGPLSLAALWLGSSARAVPSLSTLGGHERQTCCACSPPVRLRRGAFAGQPQLVTTWRSRTQRSCHSRRASALLPYLLHHASAENEQVKRQDGQAPRDAVEPEGFLRGI